MAQAWFLYTQDVVSGPFSTEEVQTKLGTGQLTAESFIWWKGQREWISVSTWQDQLPVILESTMSQAQKAVWYADLGTAPIGPLTQTELLQTLKPVSDLGRIRLWAVGMEKWMSLFELHNVMELLGISRREFDRAPLMGTVAITRGNEDPKGFVVKTGSISVAGMGVSGAHDLRRGDDIALLIKSKDLPSGMHLRGEVVYVTDAGYAGVRFVKIHPETRSIIYDYVKRFTESANASRVKAS
jgi:hypothetical protein